MKKKIKFCHPSKLSMLILKIGLPIISLVFVYILQLLLSVPENEKAWLYVNAYAMLEYAVMSFVLIFCGAVITDIAAKNR